MFSKKPSFDESPLQDLSADQLEQVAGGMDCSSSYSKDWDWKKRHHHHHHWHKKTMTTPVKVEIIIKNTSSSSWGSGNTGYEGGSHW
jgi:hypothetical protein